LLVCSAAHRAIGRRFLRGPCTRSGISASWSAIRSWLDEFADVEINNPILLALLDARLVAGTRSALRAARRDVSSADTRRRLRSLLQLIEAARSSTPRSTSSNPT
jgi:hypothetical protein